MVKVQNTKNGKKVTFAVPSENLDAPTSVVGDFNNWTPGAHPLKKRSNGTHSVTVELSGGTYEYKYLQEEGVWFSDPENHHVQQNSVLVV